MSLKKVCAIFDKKTGTFDKPVLTLHLGDILRDWEALLKDKNSKQGMYPSDFSLFQIGEYNEETGSLIPITPHIHLANGIETTAVQ